MTSFTSILKTCKSFNALSVATVDNYLMYFVAMKEGLDFEVDERLKRFRTVTKKFEKSWINLVKAQVICHRIFKKNGLLKKYIKHAAVKSIPAEQQEFLRQQADHPWRYSFHQIVANPSKYFYEMVDLFNGERFLLYSPSVTKTLAEHPVSIWFNLIAFNGACWLTYGPIVSLQSFDPDDIFFFATELNPDIESEEELMADVEQNPLPYLMLIHASHNPRIVNGEDEIVQVVADHPLEKFNSEALRKNFRLEYAKGVYRISKEPWNEPPHFAAAYYAEDRKTLLLVSMTDRGFNGLMKELNLQGMDLPEEPDVRVHLTMLIATKNILGKEVILDPYEKLYQQKSTTSENELMDKLNHLLQLALPYVNSGKEPDIEALAKEAGVDLETAREILGKSMGRINTLRDRIDKKVKK